MRPRKHWLWAIRTAVVASLTFSLPNTSNAEPSDLSIAVIVPQRSVQPNAQPEELEKIFRRQLVFDPNGQAMVPVNLPVTHPLRRIFSTLVLGLEPQDLEAYWNERYFHGISPPHVVASSEAMIRFIETTDGAIGYVLSCDVDDRVEVVWSLSLAGSSTTNGLSCRDEAIE